MKIRLPSAVLAAALVHELQRQFGLILRQEDPARAGHDAALHDLRVAIRRLRLLLQTVCESPAAAGGAAGLAWRWTRLLRDLGPARDADVWRALLAAAPAPADRPLQLLADEQRRQRRGLARRLGGYDFYRLKADTQRRLEQDLPAGLDGLPGDALNRRLAAAWRAARERVQRRGRRLALDNGEAAHRLRIACRRARYLAEVFARLPAGAPARRKWARRAARFKAVQDALGWLRDLDLLRAFLRRRRCALPETVDAFLRRRRAVNERAFRRAWRRRPGA